QYDFNFPNESYQTTKKTIFNDKLDENGKAGIPLKLETNNTPGTMEAVFYTKVFEPGGAFSTDIFSMDYFSYDTYVGLKIPRREKRDILVTDKDHVIDIISVDLNGKPVQRNDIQVEVFKISWKWWWDHSGENLTSYKINRYKKPIDKTSIATDLEGKGSYILKIKKPEWGRYLIKVKDSEGHTSGKIVYVDWPGWAGRSRGNQPGGATMLSISSDKEIYFVGDMAKLSFPSNINSRALISFENGDEIIDMFWIDPTENFSEFSFNITDKMSPNIYISIWMIQNYSTVSNDLPVRLYGFKGLEIIDKAKVLHPQITMKDVLEPEETFTISVTEKNGHPMTYTLAIVDEGILDLTRFKTPDPYKHFNKKQALGVRTWDLYNNVLGRNGLLFDKLLSIGGSDEGILSDIPLLNRFKPVVIYLGPFTLDENKNNTHQVTMPLYTGSVRTMLIAGKEGKFGATEKTSPVRKPLMVMGTAPRFISPNEKLSMPITVFINDSSITEVSIKVFHDAYFEMDSIEKSIDTRGISDKTVFFDLDVKSKIGKGKLSLIAEGGAYHSEYNFEIDIRHPLPEITIANDQLIPAGETSEIVISPVGLAGTNTSKVEISQIPSIELSSKINYLIKYPHGCLEQVTSSAFAQLYLSNIVNLPDELLQQIENNIRFAITKMSSYKTVDGNFSYWPGSGRINNWAAIYAGHFLIEAKNKGYHVPAMLTKDWIKSQQKLANK
ncbi:hypothetical protein KAJ27_10115, partial [bacterium]|nr:hypothetical protein [bacterium]